MIISIYSKYIILLHADVTFSDDFIDVINQSISKYQDFGAFCCVGVTKNIFNKIKIVISEINTQHAVLTADSCCIVINKEHNVKFDHKIFICPGLCGKCTKTGHACGNMDKFNNMEIVIPIH